ncbi:MAG: ABC transporter ATP-binding protein [Endomicrobiales bacterium]|jgi:ABC-2 type transport system ATP-binding protein
MIKITNAGIEIKNITKTFGKNKALDALNLHIEAGLLHGIIGPDGAGKTTLLRILDGLMRFDGGTIEYTADGQKVAFEDIRPAIAYMPSSASLYPDLSINEHLEFFRSLYHLPYEDFRKRSAELLAITRLDKFRDRKVGQLSGGMYKKTGLMCAMLRAPSVLLLDEPTNGVDPISRREFWELLYRLASQHILILISTSYMDEAERASRVHLIETGRLLSSGEPSTVLREQNAKTFEEIFMRKAIDDTTILTSSSRGEEKR